MVHKLVEHNEMSANFVKENDLLCTTYATCIKKGMHNLKKKILHMVFVIASNLKMRFCSKGVRVLVLSLLIHATLVTLMLVFSKLLLPNRSQILFLGARVFGCRHLC